MNEFEYINYRLNDLFDRESQFLCFPNGFRHDPNDIYSTGLTETPGKLAGYTGKSVKMLKPDGTGRSLEFSKQRIINHSWEPLELELDKEFWDIQLWEANAKRRIGYDDLYVLHSERSIQADKLERGIHWFSHGYLCSEHWYRLYKDINIATEYRDITTPWVCANRLIDNKRSYRIEFLNMLAVDRGTYSLPENDPQTGRNLLDIYSLNTVPSNQFDDGANSSAWVHVHRTTPINSAFLHVVTETVVDRVHLTEKIFKPIVLKQPFVLVGGAGCLAYLQDYGFSTFSRWWSEDYDNIQDTTERMQAVAEIVNWIGKQDRLESLRNQMKETLDYNYHWFYNGFSSRCWDELVSNINKY